MSDTPETDAALTAVNLRELLLELREFVVEQAHWTEVSGGKTDYQRQLILKIDETLTKMAMEDQ